MALSSLSGYRDRQGEPTSGQSAGKGKSGSLSAPYPPQCWIFRTLRLGPYPKMEICRRAGRFRPTREKSRRQGKACFALPDREGLLSAAVGQLWEGVPMRRISVRHLGNGCAFLTLLEISYAKAKEENMGQNQIEWEKADIVREIKRMRAGSRKAYQLKDGTRLAVLSSEPLHTRNGRTGR